MAIAQRKSESRKSNKAKPRRSSATTRTSRPKASRQPKKDMREQVRQLTLKALRDRDMTLRDVPQLAQHFIEGAAAGLNSAVPASSRNVLRQVVDGLTDAAEAIVHSTKSVVVSSASRGAKFAKHDAARTVKDLRTIEDEFVAALARAAKSLKGASKDELETIVRHSRRAGTRIKPAAQSVLKAADGHLMELGKEATSASTRAARSAVSTVLQGASGFLQGLGEAVEKKRPNRGNRKSAKRS